MHKSSNIQKLVSIIKSHIQISSQILKTIPRSVIAHPLKRHFPPSPQTNHLPTHHFSGAKVLNFGGFFPHQKTPCFFTPKKSGPRHGDVRWWRSWIPPNGKLRAFDDIFLKMCGFFFQTKDVNIWRFWGFFGVVHNKSMFKRLNGCLLLKDSRCFLEDFWKSTVWDISSRWAGVEW